MALLCVGHTKATAAARERQRLRGELMRIEQWAANFRKNRGAISASLRSRRSQRGYYGETEDGASEAYSCSEPGPIKTQIV